MNTIKVRKATQEEYKHWLLTDIPGGWKRASWQRVVRNTKRTYTHPDEGWSMYTGEVKINGNTWLAAGSSDDIDEAGGVIFWLHAPVFEIERKERIFKNVR